MGPVAKSVDLPNQVRLPYAEQGDPSGLPVLLLHGFADSWRSFGLVLPHLPESIRAFALTMRGHGDASRPTSGYGIRDFAADLAAFQDAIHLPMAVIVGHSIGAGVALRYAIDHPERTMGLVLIGGSPTMGATAAAREDRSGCMSVIVPRSHLLKDLGLSAEEDAARRPALRPVAAVRSLEVVEAEPGLEVGVESTRRSCSSGTGRRPGSGGGGPSPGRARRRR